jgi:hypothetical protein
MSQPSSVPTRVLQRHQSQIARDLLPTLKPIRSLDDQHERQCGQRTYSGMAHQALGLRTLLHFLFDRLTQFSDRWVQSIQQLQQIVPSPARPTELAEMPPTVFVPLPATAIGHEPRIEPWLPLKQPVSLAALSNSIASSPGQRNSREWTTSQTSPEK